MPIGIRQLEWLNHNSQRAYPITADSTRTDTSGAFVIPDSLLLALYLPVHYGENVSSGKFFVKAIGAYSSGISITIGYDADDGAIDVASAVIPRSTHTAGQVYALGGLGDYADSRGFVVLGDLAQLDLQPAGLFQFELAGSRLEPDCIRPYLRGVMSLQADNGVGLSSKVYGNVRLQAGRNMRITVEQAEGEDPVIVFDAIDGEGFTDVCVCQDDSPAIKSINGVQPDNNGNLQIIGNDCLLVETAGNLITLSDVCSAPCCGCAELEAITEALEAFADKAATLEMFLVNLEARVTQMDMAVLGSRIPDRGCATGCQ